MKPKKYRVAVLLAEGWDESGRALYKVKWVSGWPKVFIPYESRYETSPDADEALTFGRDTALEVARKIRLRSVVWSAMVEEA